VPTYPGYIIPVSELFVTGSPLQNVAIKGDMCNLYINITGKDGQPISGLKVLLTPIPGDPIEQYEMTMETDASGHAEQAVVRSSELEVVFVGTSFIRRITVPDRPVADLLSIASLNGLDVYSIIRNIPVQIIRRS